MKNMSNLKPYFPTVIKTSVSPITEYPWNVSPSSKCTFNQGKITFKSYINKTYLFEFPA